MFFYKIKINVLIPVHWALLPTFESTAFLAVNHLNVCPVLKQSINALLASQDTSSTTMPAIRVVREFKESLTSLTL